MRGHKYIPKVYTCPGFRYILCRAILVLYHRLRFSSQSKGSYSRRPLLQTVLRAYVLHCHIGESECPANALKLYGKTVTVRDLIDIALEDLSFYSHSGGGVTLSGGEPLFQKDFTLSALKHFKESGIHTALDTCAFVSKEIMKQTLPYTDMYLVDFKHCDPLIHKKLTGQRNEQIKENLTILSENGARIEIRIPFVPGCNDSVENMEASGKFLSSLKIETVKLLPYHSLARTKYAAIQMEDTLPGVESPDETAIQQAVSVLRAYGVNAKSGRE